MQSVVWLPCSVVLRRSEVTPLSSQLHPPFLHTIPSLISIPHLHPYFNPIPPNALSNASASPSPSSPLSSFPSPLLSSCSLPSGLSTLTSVSNHPGATLLFSTNSSSLLLSSHRLNVSFASASNLVRCAWRAEQEASKEDAVVGGEAGVCDM